MSRQREERLESAFKSWTESLVDLSNRNRLINFKLYNRSNIRLAPLDVDELYSELRRVHGWKFYFPAPEIPDEGALDATIGDQIQLAEPAVLRGPRSGELLTTEGDPSTLRKKLRTLAQRSAQIYDERALRVLYLAVGALEWEQVGATELTRSPLIFLPVELWRERPGEDYELRFVDEDPIVNPALRIKLIKDQGLAVPDDWDFEDKPLSEELRDIEEFASRSGWTVSSDVELAILQFQKMAIYEDLVANKDEVLEHPIVEKLVLGDQDSDAIAADTDSVTPIDAMPALDVMTILDADSSQLKCVQKARAGDSFVIKGPPGTGKSQTIANIIADQVGRGRSVLFVSEKIAALEVVFNRLAERGLEQLLLPLHSDKVKRKALVGELVDSLETVLEPATTIDDRKLRQYENRRKSLNEVALAIHQVRPELLSRTVFDVNSELVLLDEFREIPGASPSLLHGIDEQDEPTRLSDAFTALAANWGALENAAGWDGLDRDDLSQVDRDALRDGLLSAEKATTARDEFTAALYRETGFQVDHRSLGMMKAAEILDGLKAAPPGIANEWLEASSWIAISGAIAEASKQFEVLAELSLLKPDFPSAFEGEQAVPEIRTFISLVRDFYARWDVDEAAVGAFSEKVPMLEESAREGIKLLAEMELSLERVCDEFSLDRDEVTSAGVDQLRECAETIIESGAVIESLWLDPTGLKSAKRELEAISNSVSTAQDARAAVLERYSPDILELDGAKALSELKQGEESWSHRTFSSDFKSLRKQLKTFALANDFTLQSAKAATESIVEFQSQRTTLEGLSSQAGARLGVAFASVDTDLDSIKHCFELCDRLIDVLGTSGGRAAGPLSQLSSQPPDAQLVVLGVLRDFGRKRSAFQDGVEVLKWVAPKSESTLRSGKRSAIRNCMQELQADIDAVAMELARLRGLGCNLNKNLDLLESDLRGLGDLENARAHVLRSDERWRQVIGVDFRGDETDWEFIDIRRRWVDSVTSLPGAWPMPRATREVVCAGRAFELADWATRARESEQSFQSALDLLSKYFTWDGTILRHRPELSGRPGHVLVDTGSADTFALQKALRECLNAFEGVDMWLKFRRSVLVLRRMGWGDFTSNLIEEGVPADAIGGTWLRAYWNERLRRVLEGESALREIDSFHMETMRSDFADLDRKLIDAGPSVVAERLLTSRPTSDVFRGSEKDVLFRQSRRRGGHMSVRKLMGQIPGLLSQIKPCMMMSPLTVSSFLGPKQKFDLVIFDEASQVKPEDAMNCVYRGAQLIVAGDDRQLPPSSYFEARHDESDEQDEDQSLESLLDECSSRLSTPLELNWHYRSRDERLIAFSNHSFYGGRLTTFPSARLSADSYGVDFHLCEEGVFDRGKTATNRAEARAVANRTVEILLSGETTSLGVIAMSSAQENAIIEELDQLRIQHPSIEQFFSRDRLDSVFVKNLESVQGDEREVILLSVGYGPDADGRIIKNFGPINREGGERRLNVAVTRAQNRLELFSSMRYSDIAFSEDESVGARLLRSYLEYAEKGPSVLERSGQSQGGIESPFEQEVASELRAMGYEVHPQVGQSKYRIDLGVVDLASPGRYLAGVECDGAMYHSAPIARERDRLREDVLRDHGWNVIRIWSTDWWRDKAGSRERLRDELQGLRETDAVRVKTGAAELQTPSRVRRDLKSRDSKDDPKPAWFKRNPVPVRDITQAQIDKNFARLREEFGEILDIDEFVTALGRSFGHRRISAQMRSRLLEGLGDQVS